MENLMSALGQESEKVTRLVELLQEHGIDPSGLLDEVWACGAYLWHIQMQQAFLYMQPCNCKVYIMVTGWCPGPGQVILLWEYLAKPEDLTWQRGACSCAESTSLVSLCLVLQIEERYVEDNDENEGAPSPDSPGANEGSGDPVSLHSNAAFDASHNHDASGTDSYHAAGDAPAETLPEQPGVAGAEQVGFEGFGDENAHPAEGPALPEQDHRQAEESVSEQDGWGNAVGQSVEKTIEGLPEGELLSPPHNAQGQTEELAAQIDFGQAGAADDDWNNWD